MFMKNRESSHIDKLQLTYLHENDLNDRYYSFLAQYYNSRDLSRHIARNKWYEEGTTKHTLLAIYDDEIVGQSCAYRTKAFINGQIIDWWWGVDSFVIEKKRGLGIGKMMQNKLSKDHINFSSAWYSRVNGIIKRQLGHKEVCNISFSYYPCSRFFSVAIELIIYKFFKKVVSIPIRLPNIYQFFTFSNCSKYKIEESKLDDSIVSFINNSLESRYDFYIIRDECYLKWKYEINTTLRYRQLSISKDNALQAIIMLSEPHDTHFVTAKIHAVILLDYFIHKDSTLSFKDIIGLSIRFYTTRGVQIDGIKAIGTDNGTLHMTFPHPNVPLLSTYRGLTPQKPYISFSDQDMEQMNIE